MTTVNVGVIIDTVDTFTMGTGSLEGVLEFHGDRGYIYSQNDALFANEAPSGISKVD